MFSFNMIIFQCLWIASWNLNDMQKMITRINHHIYKTKTFTPPSVGYPKSKTLSCSILFHAAMSVANIVLWSINRSPIVTKRVLFTGWFSWGAFPRRALVANGVLLAKCGRAQQGLLEDERRSPLEICVFYDCSMIHPFAQAPVKKGERIAADFLPDKAPHLSKWRKHRNRERVITDFFPLRK